MPSHYQSAYRNSVYSDPTAFYEAKQQVGGFLGKLPSFSGSANYNDQVLGVYNSILRNRKRDGGQDAFGKFYTSVFDGYEVGSVRGLNKFFNYFKDNVELLDSKFLDKFRKGSDIGLGDISKVINGIKSNIEATESFKGLGLVGEGLRKDIEKFRTNGYFEEKRKYGANIGDLTRAGLLEVATGNQQIESASQIADIIANQFSRGAELLVEARDFLKESFTTEYNKTKVLLQKQYNNTIAQIRNAHDKAQNQVNMQVNRIRGAINQERIISNFLRKEFVFNERRFRIDLKAISDLKDQSLDISSPRSPYFASVEAAKQNVLLASITTSQSIGNRINEIKTQAQVTNDLNVALTPAQKAYLFSVRGDNAINRAVTDAFARRSQAQGQLNKLRADAEAQASQTNREAQETLLRARLRKDQTESRIQKDIDVSRNNINTYLKEYQYLQVQKSLIAEGTSLGVRGATIGYQLATLQNQFAFERNIFNLEQNFQKGLNEILNAYDKSAIELINQQNAFSGLRDVLNQPGLNQRLIPRNQAFGQQQLATNVQRPGVVAPSDFGAIFRGDLGA